VWQALLSPWECIIATCSTGCSRTAGASTPTTTTTTTTTSASEAVPGMLTVSGDSVSVTEDMTGDTVSVSEEMISTRDQATLIHSWLVVATETVRRLIST